MSLGRFAAATLAAALTLAGCGDGPENRPPVATAGADRTTVTGRPVVLDASESSDPDGDALHYYWTLIAPPGSQARLAVAFGAETAFVPDVPGTYLVTLVVVDGHAESPAVVVVTAAAPGGPGTPPDEPVAWAGPNIAATVRSTVVLDGTGSGDAYGRPLRYAWEIASRPLGSTAVLEDAAFARPHFVPDVEGEYRIELTVTDLDGITASDVVAVFVENLPPYAFPGPDRDVYVGEPVELHAEAYDPDGEPLTFAWTVASRPSGSAAVLEGGDTATPALTPDVPGFYVLSLAVSDGSGDAPETTVAVRAHPALLRLSHRARAMQFVPALDRLVMVDGTPNALYLLDPITGAEQKVVLPMAPIAVSVAPDGKHAAVGHDGNVTYVDLEGLAVVRTIPVSGVRAAVVVLAGNGYAYVLGGASADGVRAVNVETGAITTTAIYSIHSSSAAALAADEGAIYSIATNVSPADIFRVDISAGATVSVRESPYRGSYAMCGGIWLSEDGARVFTGCGTAYRAGDLTSNGRLENMTSVTSVDHSAEAHRIAVVPTGQDDRMVRVFEDTYLSQVGWATLSPFILPTGTFAAHGRHVFHTADGTRRFAIVQADATSALVADFALVEF